MMCIVLENVTQLVCSEFKEHQQVLKEKQYCTCSVD